MLRDSLGSNHKDFNTSTYLKDNSNFISFVSNLSISKILSQVYGGRFLFD